MINSLMSWLRSRIKQNTSLGIQLPTNRIEEPSVRIDLFGILLLEYQNDLDRDLYISFPWTPRLFQLTKLFGSPG